MAEKVQEGDTVVMQGEVTLVHKDGYVTLSLTGYNIPITTRIENVSFVSKRLGRGSKK